MSDDADLRARVGRVRVALAVLFAIGLAVMFWGIVGPITTGAAFAEVVVDEFALPKEAETYNKLRELFADLDTRRGLATSVLGILIALPAAYGLWETGKAKRPR